MNALTDNSASNFTENEKQLRSHCLEKDGPGTPTNFAAWRVLHKSKGQAGHGPTDNESHFSGAKENDAENKHNAGASSSSTSRGG